MDKMIPYEKMSKKRKREENAKKRNSWETLPLTLKQFPICISKSGMKKERMKDRKEDI